MKIDRLGRWQNNHGDIAVVTSLDPSSHFKWESGSESWWSLGVWHSRYHPGTTWTHLGPLKPEPKAPFSVTTEEANTKLCIEGPVSTEGVCEVTPRGSIIFVPHVVSKLSSKTPDYLKAFAACVTQAAELAEKRQAV